LVYKSNMFKLPELAMEKRALASIDSMSKNRIPPLKEMYKVFPHKRPHFDAVHKFYVDVRAELPYHHGWFSEDTVDYVNRKFGDMVEHMEYAYKPLFLLIDQCEKECARHLERLHFMQDEKLSTLLEEHPEWAEEIRRKIYNMEYQNPFDGHPLGELYGL